MGDVGGRKVSTTCSTLTSCPDSVLAKMFNPNSDLKPARTVEGVYTMDTNPDCFQVILDWLRYRQLMIPSNLTPNTVAVVAEFFGLLAMVEQLRQEHKTKTVVRVIQQRNFMVDNGQLQLGFRGNVIVEGLENLMASDPDVYKEIQRQREKLEPNNSIDLLRILVDVGGFSLKTESVEKNLYQKNSYQWTLQN